MVYPLFHNYMLVGCFALNVSLGPCFSLFRAVFRKREKEKRGRNDSESKQTPSASTASTIGPYAALERPGTESYRAQSRPDHPLYGCHYTICVMDNWN